MQSACSGGTGTFIEKTARKLADAAERLAEMPYDGHERCTRSARKCGIFAEADANTLVKAGVPVEEIIASLFEAVVYQNLATLTKGNTPLPEVLLLGGPNLFFTGLQEAWRHHLTKLWKQRKVALPEGRDPASLILVPDGRALLRCLGCVEIGATRPPTSASIRDATSSAGGSTKASTSRRPRTAARRSSPAPTTWRPSSSSADAWRAPRRPRGARAGRRRAGR